MFQDLDQTMAALVRDAAAPDALRGAQVAFDTPDRDYRPDQTTLNLFLHEIAENRVLRDEARVLERTPDAVTARLPAVRLDCDYLVTAWSHQTGGLRTAEEHALLGAALVWLARFPVVPDRVLRGSLTTQPYSLPMTVARSAEGQAMGHFWSALGIPPRPAFGLTVTVAAEPFDRSDRSPLVKNVVLKPVLDA
ncbi:DUF4255 domain-containing protein [Actinomadura fibrosa]|uniref:DUF4255 domain-containing protein n=1 Tax=Actinomadura fibrosa TaxID=111802 RepID=A0ABW2XVQ2_9ACTN|nr:DUF4255 domain-containing protein [Actinomadura fibrosa]